MKFSRINSFFSYFLAIFCLINSLSLAQNKGDTSLIKILLEKAKDLEAKNIDSAYVLTKKSYAWSQKLDFKKGMSTSFFRFGNLQLIRGNYDSALAFFKQSIQMSRVLGDAKVEAETLTKISLAFKAKGKKDSAFIYLYSALNLNETIPDSSGIGSVYNDLAELHLKYGDTEKAANYLEKAFGILSRLNDSTKLSITYIEYGIVYYYLDKYDLALSYFNKAKAIHEVHRHERYLAHDLNYLGLCYEGLENQKLALQYFNTALVFFTKLNMLHEKAEVLLNIAVSFYNTNNADSAIFYLDEGMIILEKLGHQSDLSLKTIGLLSDSYALKGNYLKAYDYHVKYSALKDSLINKEKIIQIAEMQTKYESDKKDRAIELLAEQNNTKIAQRNMLITISVLLLVVLVATSLFYLQRNRIAKKNEQLAQEKISSLLKEQEIKSYNAMIEGQEIERKRIATDLHDRIGSILSTVKLLFSSLDEKIDTVQEENMIQFSKANTLLDEAVLEVRRISYNLSTGMVNTFGLKAALEELCSSIHNSNLIRCKLLYFGLNARLTPQVEIGVYRMVQEMVTNILKHAKAKNITVQVNRSEEAISITVEDDGVGFVVSKKSTGLGLKNLKSRAMKLNGTYNVDSQPGRGTISIIEIPLNDNHDTNSDS